MTLLHSALSAGLHNASDEECLVATNDIRLVLVEFAERLAEAMKEQKELDDALTRLVNRKTWRFPPLPRRGQPRPRPARRRGARLRRR
jgi:hypothetical protein